MKNLVAQSLLLASLIASHVSMAAVLGGGVEDANIKFGASDAKCVIEACYHGGKYALATRDGKVWIVYYYWKTTEFSLAESRKISRGLIPSDSRLVRSKTTDSGAVSETYRSRELGKAFGANSDIWSGSPVGTFTIMHSPGVRKTILTVGNWE